MKHKNSCVSLLFFHFSIFHILSKQGGYTDSIKINRKGNKIPFFPCQKIGQYVRYTPDGLFWLNLYVTLNLFWFIFSYANLSMSTKSLKLDVIYQEYQSIVFLEWVHHVESEVKLVNGINKEEWFCRGKLFTIMVEISNMCWNNCRNLWNKN